MKNKFSEFKRFDSFLRQIDDLKGLDLGNIHLVCLLNVLHEIKPQTFTSIFISLNNVIDPNHGRIHIVDMEKLPPDTPEGDAITWTGKEVEEFLTKGGFVVKLTHHQKTVPVFQILVNHVASVKLKSMQESIYGFLVRKGKMLSEAHDTNFCDSKEDKDKLVDTFALARVAREIYAINQNSFLI